MNYAGDYSSGVKISGQLTLDGRMALGDNMIAIRNVYDCNHGLSYFGSDTRPFSGTYIDGPGLYGYAGGALGTVQTAAKGVEASLVFAGTSGYMSFPAFTEDFTAGITIEAWVYFSSMSNDSARIIDMGNGQANDNIVLFQDGTTSSLKFVVYTSGNSTYSCTAANVITTGAWMHLALTMDSTGAKIYKNGVAQTVTTSGTRQQMAVNSASGMRWIAWKASMLEPTTSAPRSACKPRWRLWNRPCPGWPSMRAVVATA